VVLPGAELRVEEDFAVGTVPLDSVDESEVRKLAFDRLRKSLKKGMAGRMNAGFCAYDPDIEILEVWLGDELVSATRDVAEGLNATIAGSCMCDERSGSTIG